MSPKNRQKGVSLIELMVAISILAILLFVGVPNFQTFFENSRARTITNDLAAALQLARSEAIKRRATVRVCVRNDNGNDCGTDNSNWNAGWLLISGSDDIRAWNPISPNINGTGVIAPPAGVSFLPSGIASSAANFTIDVTNHERCINVSTTGRVSVRQGACS